MCILSFFLRKWEDISGGNLPGFLEGQALWKFLQMRQALELWREVWGREDRDQGLIRGGRPEEDECFIRTKGNKATMVQIFLKTKEWKHGDRCCNVGEKGVSGSFLALEKCETHSGSVRGPPLPHTQRYQAPPSMDQWGWQHREEQAWALTLFPSVFLDSLPAIKKQYLGAQLPIFCLEYCSLPQFTPWFRNNM